MPVNLPIHSTILALIGASFLCGGALTLLPGPKRLAFTLTLIGLAFGGAAYYVW